MTAPTRTRPQSGRPGSPASPARPPAVSPADDSRPTTIALSVLTLVAALAMGRLFGGVSRLGPVLIAGALAHLVAHRGRRQGWPTALTTLAGAGAVALVLTWLLLPRTTRYGVPTARTWRLALTSLSRGVADFRTVVAPARPTTGFLLAAAVGVTVTALLSDWAAFRMKATFEAAIPSFTIFLFTSILGTSGGRGLAVAAYVAALLAFIAVHNADTLSSGMAWFTGRRARSLTASLRHAGTLGLIAVVAAVVVAPRLPGAQSDAVIDWRKNIAGPSGGGNRVTVSPLVDIRARLVNQANIEVFDVKASGRAYWRLTSLDIFDGSIWSSNGVYRPAGKHLSASAGASVPTTKITQDYSILSLGSTWLPAAYEPTHVSGIKGVGYDSESGSLLPAEPTSDSLKYTVESDVTASRLTPQLLDEAGAGVIPAAIGKRYLPLPVIPQSVAAEAQRVAGSGSPYARARALEDYFRSGRFTYDLSVPAGHDDRAMERFLFRTRRGFCEQFAGTYAVMARSVGLPTRVAVGFTPGEPGSDGQFHVFSLNAHAWPEVWLGRAGWVAFEPTPGRGVPGGEAYTGVPEAQAAPEAPATATTLPAAPTTAATNQAGPTTTAPASSRPGAARHRRPTGLLWFLAAILGLTLAWALTVPALHRAARQRQRRGARTPNDHVLVAFAEADLALSRLDAGRRSSETPHEWVRRVARKGVLPRPLTASLSQLATDAGAAWFSGGQVSAEAAEGARVAAHALEAHVLGRTTRRQRLMWALDPRPLLVRPRSARPVSNEADRAA